jgi:hypothetical protein
MRLFSKKSYTVRQGLPKFDSPGWLITGIVFSLLLSGINLWALLAQKTASFLPFRLGNILSILFGIVLGVHCTDLIFNHRRNRKGDSHNDRAADKQNTR